MVRSDKVAEALLSFDGKELSTLAQKVPLPKKSGNGSSDAMAVIQRNALVKVVDALSKHPEWILPVQGMLN